MRFGNPLGCESERKGLGPRCLGKNFLVLLARALGLKGIARALEALPHGGAINMLMTYSDSNHCHKSCCPLGSHRSTVASGATQPLTRSLSTPKQLRIPHCLRAALILPVPAKISSMRHSCRPAPVCAADSTRPNFQASFFCCFSWSMTL